MVEPQRGGKVEACAWSDYRLAVGVRLGKGRSKVHARTGRTCGADSGNGHRFFVRRRAYDHLVARGETVHVADLDIGRASAHADQKRRAARLCADIRDRDCLDSMADAVDVQPDLVPGRDVGDGRYLDVGRAGGCVRSQQGLRTWFADRGDRAHFIPLCVPGDGGIGGAVTEGNLLAHRKAGHASDGHVRRAGRDRDDRAIGEGLPQCCTIAGRRPDAHDLAGLHA